MIDSAINLAGLARPGIIEELDVEQIVSQMRDHLVTLFPDIQHVIDLESEPARKLIEVFAYREVLVRSRVNDTARAQLLAFAGGSDLDHLGAFYGVTRLSGEPDEHMRVRVQQRIKGWANAGGAEHYRYWALTSSERVRDASVWSPSDGVVRIAILASDNGGQADAALIQAVEAVVLRDDVRVLTDTVEIVPATIFVKDVEATIHLHSDTPAEVIDEIRVSFPAAVEAARGLGWDFMRSWIVSNMHPGGVHRVVLAQPVADTRVGPTECIALGDVQINFGGRDG